MGIYLPSVYTRLYPLRSNMHPSKYFRWDISWMNSNGDNWFTFILNYFNLCIFVMFSSWSSKCDPKFLNNWYLSAMVNNVKPFCLVQSLPTVWHYQISKESAGQTCTHKKCKYFKPHSVIVWCFREVAKPPFSEKCNFRIMSYPWNRK